MSQTFQEEKTVVPDEWAPAIDVGVLGPVFVRSGPSDFTPSAPKLRSVLCAMIVNSNQVVPSTLLMEELWEEAPPASWLTTLQTYVLNLRKLIGVGTGTSAREVARTVLLTTSGGYVLRLCPGALDLQRYDELVATGRRLMVQGDETGGVRALDAALRVWRGPAFLNIVGGRVLESRRRQLEESRLTVLDNMIAAQLRLGMNHEVLDELVGLTMVNPLHEGLHAHYMIALHGLGRRAEALDVFRRLRHDLVEHLGLEPGAQVQQVHQAILDSDGADDRSPLVGRFCTSRWTTPGAPARAY